MILQFNNTDKKKNCVFVTFYFTKFYPSITENILRNAIMFAKNHCEVQDEDERIIYHCQKSLLRRNDGEL